MEIGSLAVPKWSSRWTICGNETKSNRGTQKSWELRESLRKNFSDRRTCVDKGVKCTILDGTCETRARIWYITWTDILQRAYEGKRSFIPVVNRWRASRSSRCSLNWYKRLQSGCVAGVPCSYDQHSYNDHRWDDHLGPRERESKSIGGAVAEAESGASSVVVCVLAVADVAEFGCCAGWIWLCRVLISSRSIGSTSSLGVCWKRDLHSGYTCRRVLTRCPW
jgi:hypothetical protein